jgi:hypothetical protein
MESSNFFNSYNTKQYKRNQVLKEELKSLDFIKVSQILNTFKRYFQPAEPEEDIEMSTPLTQSEIDECLNEINTGLFHVSGNISKIKSELYSDKEAFKDLNQSNKLLFNINFTIKDSDYSCTYNIRLTAVGKDLFDNLNKFQKSEKIYLTHLRFQLKNNEITFIHTLATKIFVTSPSIADKTLSPIFNKKIQEALIKTQKGESEKKNLETGRQNCVTSVRINNFKNLLDLTKMNEGEYIDIINNTEINENLTKIPNKVKDFAELLCKNVEYSIYGMTNAININKSVEFRDVCGMIKFIKTEEKIKMIELLSLKDSNCIKILLYHKNMTIDLRNDMIIYIKNISWKINKNFDIILENPNEQNIKILGMLNPEESNKLKKFRFDRNKDIDCLIDLTQPVLVRSIQKVKTF